MAVSFRLAVSRLLVPMQAINTLYSRHVHLPNTASCPQTIYKPTDDHLQQLSRYFCRQPVASFTTDPKSRKKSIKVTFTDRDGDEYTVDAKLGDSLLEVAKEYDIDLEGACEGTLSCSTCHLIVDEEWFSKIPDLLTEEEQDMLDLAYGLTDTSRLGCQILVSKCIDGIRLKVPSETKDVRDF